jgi:hypothetical protein
VCFRTSIKCSQVDVQISDNLSLVDVICDEDGFVAFVSFQVMTRKGIHRSFLSATKKWFSGSRQVNPAVITNNTNVM